MTSSTSGIPVEDIQKITDGVNQAIAATNNAFASLEATVTDANSDDDDNEDEILETEDEKDALLDLIKKYNEMPMNVFCEVAARVLFEDRYPEETTVKRIEHLTLSEKMDTEITETENTLLAVFYQRIYQMLRNVHLKKPDEMIFSLYARKAGGTITSKFGPEMKCCSAILLRDFIQIQDDGQDITLRDGNVSKPMKLEKTEVLEVDPEKVKKQPHKYSKPQIVGRMNPVVLKDKSTIVLKEPGKYNKIKGKLIFTHGATHSVVKLRDHLSHVVWVAWREEDPVASQTHIDEEKKMQELMKEFQTESETTKETTK